MYKFNIKITQDDIFNSSLNYIKHSRTFFFDIIFTFVAIIATLYTIFTNSFFQLSNFKKILLILCCILFPVVQPIILYIKSGIHAKKIENLEVTLIFDEEKITVFSKDEKSEVDYGNVYNFIKYKNMVVIMYDAIHGQIIPDRVFDNNKDEFYLYVSEKIKNARKRREENNK